LLKRQQPADLYAIAWERLEQQTKSSVQVFSLVLRVLGDEYDVLSSISTKFSGMVVAVRGACSKHFTAVKCTAYSLNEQTADGALMVACKADDTSIALIALHLPPPLEIELPERHQLLSKVLGALASEGDISYNYDRVVLFGAMNYHNGMPPDNIREAMLVSAFTEVLAHDTLTEAMSFQQVLCGFQEFPPTYPPTTLNEQCMLWPGRVLFQCHPSYAVRPIQAVPIAVSPEQPPISQAALAALKVVLSFRPLEASLEKADIILSALKATIAEDAWHSESGELPHLYVQASAPFLISPAQSLVCEEASLQPAWSGASVLHSYVADINALHKRSVRLAVWHREPVFSDMLLAHGVLSLHEIDNDSPTAFRIDLVRNGQCVGELQGGCCLQPSSHLFVPGDTHANSSAESTMSRLAWGVRKTHLSGLANPDSLSEEDQANHSGTGSVHPEQALSVAATGLSNFFDNGFFDGPARACPQEAADSKQSASQSASGDGLPAGKSVFGRIKNVFKF